MDKTLRTAATGMRAQQLYIDTIANNLANVNTTGFKKSKVEFQDLLYQTIRPAGAQVAEGTKTPTELQVGCGTKPVATTKLFTQGDVVATGNSLDLAIEGEGFFQLRMPDGTYSYSRDGAFKISRDGQLVNSDGYILEPEITLPQDTQSVMISRDGLVSVMVSGTNEAQDLGQIELARFINPSGLKNIGRNLLQMTSPSGDPIIGTPDLEGFGGLGQGYLESSNVDVVEEMVNMITAQRAYEINSKSIKTADDMMGLVNNLKR
ncbi:MAG: flagellar basal-body rod protein FlgG [Actinobacteria bacterium]|nr:flagellar basal-body rod protein FlgG [Actinomycetota bacterium]